MNEYKPKVVCFSCKFGWGYLTDESTLSSEIENWIPIICTGKIDATYMIDAFKKGAGAVFAVGAANFFGKIGVPAASAAVFSNIMFAVIGPDEDGAGRFLRSIAPQNVIFTGDSGNL